MENRKEKGQVLVIVALSLIALLALVALAVDVGHIYAERRHMQNAADAGALAGAREICFGNPGNAETVAVDYATVRNRAQQADVAITGNLTVTVVTSETVDTFFGGVIGFNTVDVQAEAAAMCGRSNVLCNFLPVGFSVLKWNDLHDQCGKEFVVIDSEKICGVDYECDPDGDGIDDMIMGGARGWLDLPWPEGSDSPFETPCHRNCGQNMLSCWIENPYPGLIPIPSCILSEPGTMDSAFKTAGDQAGKIMRIPLYDGECDAADALGDCGGNEAYHIVDFGCIEIMEYDKKYEVWDIDKGKYVKEKALIVEVSCDPQCYAACATTGGETPGTGDVRGVSLVK